MISKFKILIGILVVGIVLIGGWWGLGKQIEEKNQEPNNNTETIDDIQLIIKSDKEVYKNEEPIKTELTVLNNTNKSIYYNEITSNNFDCKSITYIIKNDSEMIWKFDGITEMALVNTPSKCREIKSKNVEVFSKILLQDKDKAVFDSIEGKRKIVQGEIKVLESGTYSISAILHFSYDGENGAYGKELTKTVTSNIITIKVEKDISVTTDKTEYKQKEEIKIIIGNNLNRKLGVIDVYNGIERYENGNWVNIWNSSEYTCSCDPSCYFGGIPEINPHESMIFEWNQKMWTYCHPEASFSGLKDSTFVFVPKGTYRILVKTGDKAITYSSEFTIK